MRHSPPRPPGLAVVLAASSIALVGCGNEDVSPVNDENDSVITDPAGVANSIDGDGDDEDDVIDD